METTNPTSVGSPTKKSHFDDVFENTTWMWSIFEKILTPSAKATLLDNRLLPGYVQRPQFSRASTNSITISPGQYEINDGTTNRMVYWDSDLTYTFSNLTTVSTWCYLYLDESAISTNLLTTSEFTDSTVASTYIPARHGHYNGSDRCILAVRSNSSGEIKEFYHDGGDLIKTYIYYKDFLGTAFDWTTAQTYIPAFAQKGLLAFRGYKTNTESSAYNSVYYRIPGSAETASGYVLTVSGHSSFEYEAATLPVFTNSSQEIELKTFTTSTTRAISLIFTVEGYYFPRGM